MVFLHHHQQPKPAEEEATVSENELDDEEEVEDMDEVIMVEPTEEEPRHFAHNRITSNAATLGVAAAMEAMRAGHGLPRKGSAAVWTDDQRQREMSIPETPREAATPLRASMSMSGCFNRALLEGEGEKEDDDDDEGGGEGEILPEEPLPEVKEKDMLSWAEWRGCTSSSVSSKTISATFSSEAGDSSSKSDSREMKFYKKFTARGVRLRKFFRHKGGCAERLVRYEKSTRRLCWNSQKWWSKESGSVSFDDVLDVEQYQKIVWIKTLHLGELAFECRKEEEASIFYSVLDHLLDERPPSDGPAVGPLPRALGGPVSPGVGVSDVVMMTPAPTSAGAINKGTTGTTATVAAGDDGGGGGGSGGGGGGSGSLNVNSLQPASRPASSRPPSGMIGMKSAPTTGDTKAANGDGGGGGDGHKGRSHGDNSHAKEYALTRTRTAESLTSMQQQQQAPAH